MSDVILIQDLEKPENNLEEFVYQRTQGVKLH